MTLSSKRAEYVAIASLFISVVFFVSTLLIGIWSGYFAVWSVCWTILSAVLIWFVLVIQFHQRSTAEQEKLDMSGISSTDQSTTLFKKDQSLFAVAQKRLQLLEKWFIPFFAAVIAFYQILMAVYLFTKISGAGQFEPRQPLICAICMTAVAFVSFLMARYSTGMAANAEWRSLRAGGSMLVAVAIICFAMSAALALDYFNFPVVLGIINWAVPVVMIITGLEMALNVVLDIYRPRLQDQYNRSAFDSRLLGTINEPGQILHSAASAIDYQFGFKVSQTWFYKLLEKSILLLAVFTILVLYSMNCFLIVGTDEEAVIERFGNPVKKDNTIRLVGPGLTLKYPWPIDAAYKYPTKKIMELSIGFVPEIDPKTGLSKRKPLLWGKQHYAQEYSVLVAGKQSVSSEGSVPISIIKANLPVQYRVKDLYKYMYNYEQPQRQLESICYQELAKFAASSTIGVDTAEQLETSLLGAGRIKAKQVLMENIQQAADKAGLGVEIVFLGLQGIHPPAEDAVAQEYQKVIGAVQAKESLILNADAVRNYILGNLAGSIEKANELYELVNEYQRIKDTENERYTEELASRIDNAFAQAEGEIFKTLRQAKGYAFEKTILAKATGDRFASQLEAYNASKDFYIQNQRLNVMEESLRNTRKYVIVADSNDSQVFILDLKEKLAPDLYDIGGFEEK